MKMLMNLFNANGPEISKSIDPVFQVLQVALPVALAIVGVIGVIKCIALGMAFAKSDENGTHEKAKKDLINAIIGFLLIFVLIGIMWLLLEPMATWLADTVGNDWDFY